MHSSSNLSMTCGLVRCFVGFPISLAFDGFLNTSRRLRFLSLALSSLAWRCVSLEWCASWWCDCEWSRIELDPPCNIDLTACTSRFSGDSLTLFFSKKSTQTSNEIIVPQLPLHAAFKWLNYLSIVVGFFRDSISSTAYRTGHCHKIHSHSCILYHDQFANRMNVTNTWLLRAIVPLSQLECNPLITVRTWNRKPRNSIRHKKKKNLIKT